MHSARASVDGDPALHAEVRARYAALDGLAEEHGADAVLLGHTRDDQAETVLLGLARGSGARSLSGMAPRQGRYRRPLLDLTREDTRAACAAEQLTPWEDPHNEDPAFLRVRVRREVLPVLERELGPGVSEALARTARTVALAATGMLLAAGCGDADGGDGDTSDTTAPGGIERSSATASDRRSARASLAPVRIALSSRA